eukprot:m.160958 g.160958  ORF g.160958 m.160958 type:complete len:81 (+) comp31207_c1_seq1:377-619(+)
MSKTRGSPVAMRCKGKGEDTRLIFAAPIDANITPTTWTIAYQPGILNVRIANNDTSLVYIRVATIDIVASTSAYVLTLAS